LAFSTRSHNAKSASGDRPRLVAIGWHLGKQLDRVCELSGEHDVVVANPTTDREELDNICADRLADPEPSE